MRTIKRIIKINRVDGYKVSCLFNNGESRVIDFKKLFEKWNIQEGHPAYPLLKEPDAFNQLELEDGTLVWKNIQIESKDEKGNKVIHYFDLDPIVLYS